MDRSRETELICIDFVLRLCLLQKQTYVLAYLQEATPVVPRFANSCRRIMSQMDDTDRNKLFGNSPTFARRAMPMSTAEQHTATSPRGLLLSARD